VYRLLLYKHWFLPNFELKDFPELTFTPCIILRQVSSHHCDPKGIERVLKTGCGIQMSQATPTKFSMLFKQTYGKVLWKFGDHSFNFSFVHGPSWLRVLESIHRYGVIFTFWKKNSKGHCEAMLDLTKIFYWHVTSILVCCIFYYKHQ
jgi:hypothetical protein